MAGKFSRRDFLAGAAGTTGLFTLGCSSITREGDKKPRDQTNIVLIFTDDQGWADVGCYGAKGFETPNLDRMAAEGIRFTDFYVPQAVCSASRAGLMTGCYPTRIGIRGALGPASKIGINPKEETIAEVLGKAGYVSGIFGKWHLGHHRKFLPLNHGFSEYFGLPYSNDMWPVDYDGTYPPRKKWKMRYPFPPLIDGFEKVGEIRSLEDQARLTTLYTERAVRFIRKNKDRPFFLYVPHSMPHTPLGVSGKFKGKSKQGPYGDVIMEIDWSVGRILETLKECGIEDKTLVVFTSDNGPWLNFGKYAGSAGPLREGKGTSFEGGIRVPCIMRWPGMIPAGRVVREIACTIDFLPTFAHMAKAPLPRNKIDGIDILPLILGEPGAKGRDNLLVYYNSGRNDQLQAIRKGPWKLHFPHFHRSYEGMPRGKNDMPGPTKRRWIGLSLFNLEEDIGERNNVAKAHPEIVKMFERLRETAREDIGDGPVRGKGYRPPGRI